MKIAMSSGHGAKISGANDIIKEHESAVRVVNKTAEYLRALGVEVQTYEDKQSTTQNSNLENLVNWHNNIAFGGAAHDLDVSIHFNSSNGRTSNPIGTECWYYSQEELAEQVAEDMAGASGLIDRGAKRSTGLYFLVHCREPALLDEVCFVNSSEDCRLFEQHFDALCETLAGALSGQEVVPVPPPLPHDVLFYARGKCSWFGGPEDTGVSPSEQLAFFEGDDGFNKARHLFLEQAPPNTSGLARRLDPGVHYVAVRWDYSKTPKEMLRNQSRKALVRANGREFLAYPADWGPNESETGGRVADLSPSLLNDLGLTTDQEVEVIYPGELG